MGCGDAVGIQAGGDIVDYYIFEIGIVRQPFDFDGNVFAGVGVGVEVCLVACGYVCQVNGVERGEGMAVVGGIFHASYYGGRGALRQPCRELQPCVTNGNPASGHVGQDDVHAAVVYPQAVGCRSVWQYGVLVDVVIAVVPAWRPRDVLLIGGIQLVEVLYVGQGVYVATEGGEGDGQGPFGGVACADGAHVEVVACGVMQPGEPDAVGEDSQCCALAVGKAVQTVFHFVVLGACVVAPVQSDGAEGVAGGCDAKGLLTGGDRGYLDVVDFGVACALPECDAAVGTCVVLEGDKEVCPVLRGLWGNRVDGDIDGVATA